MQDPGSPTVSAIILNYNYGRYVGRAIESALTQSIPFAEIIVVDDGSTDESLAIIRAYEPRVKVLAKGNTGQLSSCIAAIAQATGEYIYILDADDWLAPDMHANIIPALKLHPAKIQFQLRAIGETAAGSVFPAFPEGYNSEQMRQDNKTIGFYICPPTSGNVYSRKALAQIALQLLDARETLDGVPALLMPYMGHVVSITKPLAHYFVHEGSDSQATTISEEVLQKELVRFAARWEVAKAILGAGHESDIEGSVLYLSERRLMIAALQNKLFVIGKVAPYIYDLWRTHYSTKHKVVFTAWGLSLILPAATSRQAAIRFRRNGTSRPEWLSKAVAYINGRQ